MAKNKRHFIRSNQARGIILLLLLPVLLILARYRMIKSFCQQKKQRGAIMLMVLGLLMLLSAIVVVFLKNLTQDIRIHTQLFGKSDLKHYAYNGLNAVWSALEYRLSKGDVPWEPTQGWTAFLQKAQLTLPDGLQLKVNVQDESGKIPLNGQNLDKKLLLALFGQFGDYMDAQSMMQAYLKWLKRKPTEVNFVEGKTIFAGVPQPEVQKKKQETKDQEKPEEKEEEPKVSQKKTKIYFPTQLNDYQQLVEMEEFQNKFFDKNNQPNERFRQLKACTTLFGSLPININAAPKEVLDCLSKIYMLEVDQIMAYLHGTDNTNKKPKYYKSLDEIKNLGHGSFQVYSEENNENNEDGSKKEKTPSNLLVGVKPHIFRVEIEVLRADVSYLLTAILKGGEPATLSSDKNKEKDLTKDKKSEYNNSLEKKKKGSQQTKLELVILQEGRLEN